MSSIRIRVHLDPAAGDGGGGAGKCDVKFCKFETSASDIELVRLANAESLHPFSSEAVF